MKEHLSLKETVVDCCLQQSVMFLDNEAQE